MKTRLRNLAQEMLASYWFIPTLMALFGAVAAVFALRWGPQPAAAPGSDAFGWLNVNTAEGARQLLATIAGSTITLAGVTFSITVLALSFASAQYGPRLLRSFMRDRPSQVVLGTFVSTYLYCLLVLRTIGTETTTAAVPHAAVAGALIFGMSSIAVLIFFVHHIASSIQVSSIIAAVGRDLDGLIAHWRERARSHPAAPAPLHPAGRHVVRARHTGYVQALAEEDLLAAAREHDWIVRLHAAPGDFVGFGQPLAEIFAADEVAAAHDADGVRDAFVLGRQRTGEQDLEFPLDQLAEVAVRALSPSTNDPFTAVLCIGRLGSAIAELFSFNWPAAQICDAGGRVRVELLPRTPQRVLARAFNQILHFGDTNPVIPRQVMKALALAAPLATREHRLALADFARHVRAVAQRQASAAATMPDFLEFFRAATAST